MKGRKGASVEFLVFTTDPQAYDLEIPVSLTSLGFEEERQCYITDIWTGTELGVFKGSEFKPVIPAHGCGYYKITPGQLSPDGMEVREASPSSSHPHSSDIYSITGQKVSHPHQGMYIVNGKKLIVK